MRVTFLMPGWAWTPSGGYRVVYALASALAARGHDIAVVHPRMMPADALAPAGLELRLRRRVDRLRNLLVRPAVRWERMHPAVRMLYVPDLAERHIPDADAVVATFWSTAEAALRYGPQKGAPAYLVQSYETWGGPQERVDATWRAPLFKLVIARWLLEQGRALGVPADDMTHVPLAIDHDVFRTTRPVAGRPPRVATQYAAATVKGFDVALQAMQLARVRVPQMSAVAFGIDRRPSQLPAWIEYHRNPSQQALAEEVYARAAVYLCASFLEGWHLPPAEALACGCAVASSDIGGVRDYARDGETALLAPAGDAPALAGAVTRLLGDEALRTRLAHAGRDLIGTFRWERSAALMEDALHTLLSRSQGVVR